MIATSSKKSANDDVKADSGVQSNAASRTAAKSRDYVTSQRPKAVSKVSPSQHRKKRKKRNFYGRGTLGNWSILKDGSNLSKISLEAYSKLFKEFLDEPPPTTKGLEASWVGASLWTPAEKARLFESLSKVGETQIRTIAQAIGSKGELEVAAYLNECYDAIPRMPLGPNALDVPAAYEVSESFEARLAPFAARSVQSRFDTEDSGNELHPLLTKETGAAWNSAFFRGYLDNSARALAKNLPEALLLDLETMLLLSERFFMNSSDSNDNWYHLSKGKNEPSIETSAFTHLHSHILDFVRLLIKSSLLIAMSRQRTTPNTSLMVTREDVEATLAIRDIKLSEDFWIDMPRKCNLKVVDDGFADSNHNQGQTATAENNSTEHESILEETYLSYDTVEQLLRSSERSNKYLTAKRELGPPKSIALSPAQDNDPVLVDSSQSDTETGYPNQDYEEPFFDNDDVENDEMLQAADLIDSQADEDRLRRVLGIRPKAPRESPDRPDSRLHRELCRSRWTESVGYASEWEMTDLSSKPTAQRA